MENNDTELEDIFAQHEPDLDGFSDTVKARFQEAIGRTVKRDDFINYPRAKDP